jgi:hypothetical protein
MRLNTTQRILIAAASALLLAGIVFVAVDNDDDGPTVSAIATPSATAAAGASPVATSKAPAATAAPSQASDAPAVTAAPAGASSAPSGAAKPATRITPPKEGTYRYKQTSDGQTSTVTLEIEDKGSGKQSETQSDGSQGAVTADVEYRPDGKYDTKSTFGEPPQGFTCDWKPDLLEARFPIAAGQTWDVKSSCTSTVGAASITITVNGKATVRGSERATVGGTPVDVWVGHFEGTINFKTPQGNFSQKVTSDDRISPKYGVTVRSTETSEGTNPQTGQEQKTKATRELVSLTPS